MRSVFIALVLPVGLVRAQDTTDHFEERLHRLESTVQALQEENAALRRELHGTVGRGETVNGGTTVIGPNGRENKLLVGGFLQAQGEFGDAGDSRFKGTNDRLYLRRARMFIAGSFAEHFEFKVEGEFAANTLAPSRSLRASANDLFVGWTRFPMANVRFGQIKPAFGGEQLASEIRARTIEHYLGSDRLADSRQIGMSVGGSLIPDRLSYLVVVGNGTGPNASENDNSKFTQTARLAAVAFDRADLGRLVVATGVTHSEDAGVTRMGFGFDAVPGGALDNLFAGRRHGWGADATWHRGLLDFSAELLRLHFEPKNRLPAASFSAQGWEAMAACFVVPNTLQAVVRRESFDPNMTVVGDQTNNWVLGINYLIKGEDLRLMADYLFGHNADSPADRGRLLTRFQVLF